MSASRSGGRAAPAALPIGFLLILWAPGAGGETGAEPKAQPAEVPAEWVAGPEETGPVLVADREVLGWDGEDVSGEPRRVRLDRDLEVVCGAPAPWRRGVLLLARRLPDREPPAPEPGSTFFRTLLLLRDFAREFDAESLLLWVDFRTGRTHRLLCTARDRAGRTPLLDDALERTTRATDVSADNDLLDVSLDGENRIVVKAEDARVYALALRGGRAVRADLLEDPMPAAGSERGDLAGRHGLIVRRDGGDEAPPCERP